jgi:MATE family multidrug resistance protein
MVPLSIGHASSVKIGYAYGKNKINEISSYANASLILVLVFACFSSLAYLIFPRQIMQALTDDQSVVLIGISLFFPIAIFQIVDAFQVCMGGILRGLEETKITSKLIFCAYWIIGIPGGSLMAFYYDKGFISLWYGIVVALAIVALGLTFYYFKIIHRLKESITVPD